MPFSVLVRDIAILFPWGAVVQVQNTSLCSCRLYAAVISVQSKCRLFVRVKQKDIEVVLVERKLPAWGDRSEQPALQRMLEFCADPFVLRKLLRSDWRCIPWFDQCTERGLRRPGANTLFVASPLRRQFPPRRCGRRTRAPSAHFVGRPGRLCRRLVAYSVVGICAN